MTIYLDTETTGLNAARDEILEIGILDDQGRALLDSLVRPVKKRTWREAQAIHGISPTDVATAPTLDELRPDIINAVRGREVVIYNAAFDSRFLPAELEYATEIKCCMLPFAEIYSEWNYYRQSYKWQKLTTAAGYVGYEWPAAAHRAIEDCKATRAVWRYLVAQFRGQSSY